MGAVPVVEVTATIPVADVKMTVAVVLALEPPVAAIAAAQRLVKATI